MPLNITEDVIENDTVRIFEDGTGTVIIEDKISGSQVALNDDIELADVASHLAAGDNPHATTLEQARAEDNQLSGPVDVGDDIATPDGTTIWDSATGVVPRAQLGGPASSLSAYPLSLAADTEASAYPLANADLANSNVAVEAGAGLTTTNVTIGLGGSATIAVEPADFAGALLSDDGADNLQVDESDIDHDNIDQSTVDADDHHDEDHAERHGAGGDDELATALRYGPEGEPDRKSVV